MTDNVYIFAFIGFEKRNLSFTENAALCETISAIVNCVECGKTVRHGGALRSASVFCMNMFVDVSMWRTPFSNLQIYLCNEMRRDGVINFRATVLCACVCLNNIFVLVIGGGGNEEVKQLYVYTDTHNQPPRPTI